jgi:3-isopropylmalate/(R)-2-methylmalate dehydratase small subunit
MIFEGNAHVYGNNVDTDVIIAADCLKLDDSQVMATYAMKSIDPEFTERVKEGDIIIGGENFGSGSSREQAPMVLSLNGIKAIVAPSYAGIFRKNSVEGGYAWPLVCKDVVKATMGDRIRIDTDELTLENLRNGEKYKLKPLKKIEETLLENGGFINYTKKKMREERKK